MIRVAAVGDIHVGEDCTGCVNLAEAAADADLLLLAGDLTRVGSPAESRVLAGELEGMPIPVVAVLGNHDYQSNRQDEVAAILRHAGVWVLEGDGVVLDIGGSRVGVAGGKGFGGGFVGACATEFGEPETKAFVAHSRLLAEQLGEALGSLGTSTRIALTHYAPVEATLEGERREIYPFLGSYLLGEAIDKAGANLALHGHAHAGSEKGSTPCGVPVRNVARPVIQSPYNVYVLDEGPEARSAARRASREKLPV
jgi:Icc-related predicted phosphoesterase